MSEKTHVPLVLKKYTGTHNGRPAGTWKPLKTSDGKTNATVACPGCGKTATLESHRIHRDGHVWPSLVCPNNCGFHDFVYLKDWTEEVS